MIYLLIFLTIALFFQAIRTQLVWYVLLFCLSFILLIYMFIWEATGIIEINSYLERNNINY